MLRYPELLCDFIPLYRIVPAAGRVAAFWMIAGFTAAAFGQSGTDIPHARPVEGCDGFRSGGTPCYGQVDTAALAAPPCGLFSYSRIWLRPGCFPPSFCKFRCSDSTHIWDGYCNQQSEKLNRQLNRQLYYTQREHIARGWPWYGGHYGQTPCPGFGPSAATMSHAGVTPTESLSGGEGHSEVVSDEFVMEEPTEPSRTPSLKPIPATAAPADQIMPLPPIETSDSGASDAAKAD